MRIAFIILRKNYYRLLGPAVDEALVAAGASNVGTTGASHEAVPRVRSFRI